MQPQYIACPYKHLTQMKTTSPNSQYHSRIVRVCHNDQEMSQQFASLNDNEYNQGLAEEWFQAALQHLPLAPNLKLFQVEYFHVSDYTQLTNVFLLHTSDYNKSYWTFSIKLTYLFTIMKTCFLNIQVSFFTPPPKKKMYIRYS